MRWWTCELVNVVIREDVLLVLTLKFCSFLYRVDLVHVRCSLGGIDFL